MDVWIKILKQAQVIAWRSIARTRIAARDASAAPHRAPRSRGLLWRWGGEKVLWLVLAIGVIVVAIVPLIYTIDAQFYRETRIGLAPDRSLDGRDATSISARNISGYLASALLLAAHRDGCSRSSSASRWRCSWRAPICRPRTRSGTC